MKILVVSDTHKDTATLATLLEKYCNQVQMVCHLGDHADDLLCFQAKYPALTMVTVAGNCDSVLSVDAERVLTLPPHRIFLAHGHNHGVKMNLDRLAYYAREKDAHACFFGHTHMPVVLWYGSILMLNPGSLGAPRIGDKPSYALVEIGDTITGEVMYL